MRKFYAILFCGLLLIFASANAQQLPNADFEDWSGAAYDGQIQPANWNASNVTQLGFKFNFAHREAGHTGSWSMMVQNQSVGALGITETGPGYFSLGQPWSYLPSISQISQATAGTYGGINFTYRPDSMEVWIRRTGNDWANEDFYLLYYAWKGTAQGTSYKGKNNGCTSVSYTNEESDIRQALDANECTTSQFATQISEGMWRERAEYTNWTKITVPIYYMNNDVPEMCNIIFSASNYPNFRANTGLYEGNSLYVDDVRLVYSSKIQHLFIGNKEWKGFDPNSTEEQVYSVGNGVSTIPEIYATRGEGSLTNARGTTAAFTGRRLQDSEMSITPGVVDGAPTVITVNAEDGSSTTTYRIRFVSAPSNNAKLAGITVNGTALVGFNPLITNYNVALPYGTTAAPVIDYTKAEDAQNVTLTQATSPTGTANIQVIAADGTTTKTYTLQFSVALLSDNTLQGIRVNGEPILSFQSQQTIYKVELPLGTTQMPAIEAISAYPQGAQTIVYTAPAQIDGGQYQIAVSTPGNPTPKVYKLNFKITASTNSKLQSLSCGDYITNFEPQTTTYYVNLPIGTTSLPSITYTAGDAYQTITMDESGVTGTDGTVRIIVTAANGDQTIYKVVFATEKSSVNTLQNIYIGGVALAGFSPEQQNYEVQLPIGTTELPAITWTQGDEYQTVTLRENGINGVARISVTAGDGTTKLYQITFSVLKTTNANLQMIYLDGVALAEFNPSVLEYNINLSESVTVLPTITYTAGDEWQTITTRGFTGLTGDYKITVRPQEGSSQTYILHFTQTFSVNTDLQMIYLDGEPLAGFSADVTVYSMTLPMGVSQTPTITYDKAEGSQNVLLLIDHTTATLRVTAASGASKVYTINFILQKSENALLQMIYLDGEPLDGFEPNTLTGYEVVLTGNTCPTITVDKELGQQVTILAPQFAGEAQIIVTPETGASNTYRILFTQAVDEHLLLNNIYLNGIALDGFAPETDTYNLTVAQSIPEVTFTKENENQEVTVLINNNTVRLVVGYDNKTFTYTLNFTQELSADCDLQAILVNGTPIAGFNANTLDYTLSLGAGEAQPVVTYSLKTDRQHAILGHTDTNTISIIVTAENGTSKTYTVHFNQAEYSNAILTDLRLNGSTVAGFSSTKYAYSVDIEEGIALPNLTYTAATGCHTVSLTASPTEQQVLVIAESGAKATYTITYHKQLSNNALLSNILIEGVTLEGFASDRYSYTYALPRRTKTVPTVQPIAGNIGQTITVYFSRPDGTTRIHVMAEDGVTEANYTIAFPMAKSSNTALESVYFNDLDFELQAGVYAYTIVLPEGLDTVPTLTYEKQEPEQRVALDLRGVNETTTLTVTAEDGTQAIYKFDFQRTISNKFNGLYKIWLNETQLIDLTYLTSQNGDNTEFVFTVPMPYGSKQFDITFEPYYAEQTIIAQAGGIKHPTEITCKANRADEADVHYTIIPQVATTHPARLTSISVNGVNISDFDPDRLSYIVNISATPMTSATPATGANMTILRNDAKVWQAQIDAGEYSRVYTLHYFYPADIIPNADFTEWEAAKYNSAVKPSYWTVPADKAGIYAGTAKTGSEITRSGDDVVSLSTKYWAALASGIPAMMTLGSMSFAFAVAGATNATFSDGIAFHNTPDTVLINYHYQKKAGNGALFAFRFFDDDNNERAFDYITESNTSSYVTYAHTLATDGLDVRKMNIAINATNQESGTSSGAQLYVDWLRFVYNSRLIGLQVNGEAAARVDNAFTFSLLDAEQTELPDLSFTGEVSDQAQEVIWADEENGVRNATIRNFAEDGTYTDYTLQVVRPLSTIAYPKSIMLDNQPLDGFTATSEAQTDYTVYLRHGYTRLPSLNVLPETSLQTITVAAMGMDYTITVTAENGNSKTYTIHFEELSSNNATLATLTAEGVVYHPETTNYTITTAVMPDFTFTRHTDGQRATLTYPADNQAQIKVIAENGAENTYTFLHQPAEVTTSGLLKNILLEDMDIEGYSKNTFAYTHDAPQYTSFVREYDTDSVIQTITSAGMEWRVMGTTEHTYTLTYPTDPSTECRLGNVLLNGATYAEFLADQHDYTIQTDDYIDIQLVQGHENQSLAIDYNAPVLTITPTAESGITCAPYTLRIVAELSSNATLQSIFLDGVLVEDFEPERTDYTVTIPCANPKTEQPLMPSIAYELGQAKQTVEIEAAPLGGTTYLTVTAENGNQKQYALTIQAEPSHNAELANILVNGQPVSYFEPTRLWYSAMVEGEDAVIDYSTLDSYQTITQSVTAEGVHEIHVTAEDGITQNTYAIELWVKPLSVNAFLRDIRLNGLTFSQYDETSIDFDSNQLRYQLNLPADETTLPDIYVALGENGQSWVLLQGEEVDTIRVTAPNGFTTNDYILQFVRKKSNNALLQMIYLNDQPLNEFDPMQFNYLVELPIGTANLPDLYIVKQELTQTYTTTWNGNTASILVTAEDNITTSSYELQFTILQSDADTLQMIYADGHPLQDFDAQQFTYYYLLPVGISAIPEISYDEADQWQTIHTESFETATATTFQIFVQAQSGRSHTYTVTYELQKSAIDTLQMILIGGQDLAGFHANVLNYEINLPYGTQMVPEVDYITGDNYQAVSVVLEAIGGITRIVVTAENGQSRTYSLHFTVEPSHNADLSMITIANEPIANFDGEIYTYNLSLPYGTETLPIVTFEKGEEQQRVTMQVNDKQVVINVIAADGITQNTYMLNFTILRSDYALLGAILLDGKRLENFESVITEYNITLPHGTQTLPEIGYVLGNEQQAVTVIMEGNLVTIEVVAGNGEEVAEYSLRFEIEKSSINTLADLLVKGEQIEGFAPDNQEYTLTYPAGSTTDDFVQLDDVTYILADEDATATITEQEDGTLILLVTAENGEPNAYIIHQIILLEDNNLLAGILVNGVTIQGFSPDKYEYEYLLYEGGIIPFVEANAQSALATVDITMGQVNELTYIYCTAEDGSEAVYTILFTVTDINTGKPASDKDVCIKQIPGTHQFYATTNRQNVQFGLYDMYGHCYFMQMLPLCDPNTITLAQDATNDLVFINTSLVDNLTTTQPNVEPMLTGNAIYTTLTNGIVFELPTVGGIYTYVFLQDGQVLKSGKTMLAR